MWKLGAATLVLSTNLAVAQTVDFDASQVSCEDFRSLIAAAESGSSEFLAVQAEAYQNALFDVFDWYFGRSSIEREWSRVIGRCETTLFDAAERLSENVFYEFESELRMQIEYESE